MSEQSITRLNKTDINSIQLCIGYEFKNSDLLAAAFTHSSYVNEHSAVGNERIEFLGDCALNFLVGERLFMQDRTASEGKLSARRAALVSRTPLARIVDSLGLLKFLQVGAGVDKSRFSDKARSDLFEAILGAVYLDGGLTSCGKVLDKIFYGAVKPVVDYKSALQIYCAAHGLAVEYTTTEAGGGFRSTAKVGAFVYIGEGRSKRAAESSAAQLAVEALNAVGE